MTQPKITDAIAQKIRRSYVYHSRKRDAVDSVAPEYHEGKADGIRDTLDFLGIEIDYINGGEAE